MSGQDAISTRMPDLTMPDPSTAPLILTLAMEAETFARFDALRRRHFPAALNHIPAHATLFHHLPGRDEAAIRAVIAAEARAQAPPEVAVTGLRFTGRGVAYALESAPLSAFRARLANRFSADLSAQDRQGWRPHVTVQNKVAPDVARALHAALERDFVAVRFTAPGVSLWRYLGGPWQERAAFAFGQAGLGL